VTYVKLPYVLSKLIRPHAFSDFPPYMSTNGKTFPVLTSREDFQSLLFSAEDPAPVALFIANQISD